MDYHGFNGSSFPCQQFFPIFFGHFNGGPRCCHFPVVLGNAFVDDGPLGSFVAARPGLNNPNTPMMFPSNMVIPCYSY